MNRWIAFALFCLATGSVFADPWGKDADMAYAKTNLPRCSPKTCTTPFFGRLSESLIHFHQKVISPADGPRSHFIPSSSQYALEAIRKYGFFKGFAMGCDRLMRENKDPWVYRTVLDGAGNRIKWDPVP